MKNFQKNRRFLFQLNHPAHFHLFKNTIKELENRGHQVLITIKDKDILINLVKDYKYIQISRGYRKNNTISILHSLISRDIELYKVAKNFRPDLLIGTSPEIAHISRFLHTPSLFLGEDDVNLSFTMFLGALASYPLFDKILSPKYVNNSIWNKKTIFYNGYQKLAYLHPVRFIPNRQLVQVPSDIHYFMLRFSGLSSYHDSGKSGISDSLAMELINLLSRKGHIMISSERPLPESLEKYRYNGNLNDIHHYLAFADLFIGDSQSMCIESALLGTPYIRYNDFVGKITVMNEIEQKYKLGVGIKSGNTEELLSTVHNFISTPEFNESFQERRHQLISDKIDVTAFYVWFIENYPNSIDIMREDSNYDSRFK